MVQGVIPRCSGVPRSQQSLTWHCSTHGGPGPPVTTQTSHTCYSCHHPFRPGTRPLACLAQGCINLAHAARRCSGLLLPPTSGVTFTTATTPKRLQACQHLPSPSMSTEEPKQNHLKRVPPHDCCQHPAVRLQPLQHCLPPHLLRPLP